MEFLISLRTLLQLMVFSLGISDVATVDGDKIAYGNYKNKCDWSKCLSPQLSDATKTEDKHNICRLLTPSLHCMQTKLPACRLVMGEDNEMYRVFQKELRKLHLEYSERCHAIYTTCQEFTKCLRPEMQEASHHQDIHSLCRIAPTVISCFENAIQTCQARSGFEDENFDLIENKLDKLRTQTSARCCGFSYIFGDAPSTRLILLVPILTLLRSRLEL